MLEAMAARIPQGLVLEEGEVVQEDLHRLVMAEVVVALEDRCLTATGEVEVEREDQKSQAPAEVAEEVVQELRWEVEVEERREYGLLEEEVVADDFE